MLFIYTPSIRENRETISLEAFGIAADSQSAEAIDRFYVNYRPSRIASNISSSASNGLHIPFSFIPRRQRNVRQNQLNKQAGSFERFVRPS